MLMCPSCPFYRHASYSCRKYDYDVFHLGLSAEADGCTTSSDIERKTVPMLCLYTYALVEHAILPAHVQTSRVTDPAHGHKGSSFPCLTALCSPAVRLRLMRAVTGAAISAASDGTLPDGQQHLHSPCPAPKFSMIINSCDSH